MPLIVHLVAEDILLAQQAGRASTSGIFDAGSRAHIFATVSSQVFVMYFVFLSQR